MRVASDPRHGAGHLSRSGVLARALARDAPVTVAVDSGTSGAAGRLEHPGIRIVEAGQEGDGPWRGCVLDGYGFAPATIEALASRARPLIVFDDLLAPPPQASLAINPAIGLAGDEIKGIPALLGPGFACVDPRFAAPPPRPIGAVDHVVVTFGAADPGNITGLTLAAFAQLAANGVVPRLSVVLGAVAPHRDAVAAAVARSAQARLLVDPPDMAILLRDADLVVGAGGVSLFERLAAGVPSVTLVIADNQRFSVRGAVAAGATIDGGEAIAGGVDPADLARTIAGLIGDRPTRAALRESGRRLVDCLGAERVAGRISALARSFKAAGKQAAGLC